MIKKLDDLLEVLLNPKKGMDDLLDQVDEAAELIKKKNKQKKINAINMWKDFKHTDLTAIPPPAKKLPCFLIGTLISAKDGLVPIEQLNVGDEVYTFDFNSQTQKLKPIVDLHRNTTEKYLVIEINNIEIIQATGGHRFWIPKLNNWVQARKLKIGDVFLTQNKLLATITNLKIVDKNVKTYNLEIADNHNYYVGKTQILTHNANKISSFKSLFKKEVEFYTLSSRNGNTIADLCVGQTIQGIDKRYGQHLYAHRKNPKKKPWMEGVFPTPIKIGNATNFGPYKMTPFEAAVVEMHELYKKGGKRKDGKGLYNRVNPISKTKFEIHKALNLFNPCEFYA